MQSPNDNSSVNSQIIDWSQFVPGSDEAVITDVLLKRATIRIWVHVRCHLFLLKWFPDGESKYYHWYMPSLRYGQYWSKIQQIQLYTMSKTKI